MVVRWDNVAHYKTIERTIRGLYYHHFGEILGERVAINVQWLRGLNEDIIDMCKMLQVNKVGGDALVYRYGRAEEAPAHSLWIFQFYERHWASGYSMPRNDL